MSVTVPTSTVLTAASDTPGLFRLTWLHHPTHDPLVLHVATERVGLVLLFWPPKKSNPMSLSPAIRLYKPSELPPQALVPRLNSYATCADAVAELVQVAFGLVAVGLGVAFRTLEPASGSATRTVRGSRLPVTEVAAVTGSPEMLDGRVKTLHPAIHGGLLARRDRPDHLATLAEHCIGEIDLLVSNLYPFAATVASGAGREDCVENIDIGGVALIRTEDALSKERACRSFLPERRTAIAGMPPDSGRFRSIQALAPASAWKRYCQRGRKPASRSSLLL